MRGTSSGVPRAARRILGGATAAAVIGFTIMGVLGFAGQAGAASSTEIRFASCGIEVNGDSTCSSSPAVTIQPGSSVVFSNDIDPSAGVPVLGGVTGLISSVDVRVTGATQNAFTVARGQRQTVDGYSSGSTPFVVHFTATYDARTLLGSNQKSFNGTITVAATPQKSKSTSTPGSQPTATPSSQPASTPSKAPVATHSSASQPTSSASTISGYSPPPTDVASSVLPKGNGGPYHGDRHSASTPTHRQSATPTHHASRSSQPRTERTQSSGYHPVDRRAGGQDSIDERPIDTVAAASPAGALPFAVNWPAIMAVALLSTVAVALVHTFMAHRRSP